MNLFNLFHEFFSDPLKRAQQAKETRSREKAPSATDVPADVLASTLFNEFVKKPIHGMSETFNIDTDVSSPSGRKLLLYQYASVLIAVLGAEHRDKTFLPVRVCLERHFFPPSFAQGADLLDEVRSAMRDLGELIQPDVPRQELSWARRWLSSAGIQEDNPATLAMFAHRWPAHFVTVTEALQHFRPVT